MVEQGRRFLVRRGTWIGHDENDEIETMEGTQMVIQMQRLNGRMPEQ